MVCSQFIARMDKLKIPVTSVLSLCFLCKFIRLARNIRVGLKNLLQLIPLIKLCHIYPRLLIVSQQYTFNDWREFIVSSINLFYELSYLYFEMKNKRAPHLLIVLQKRNLKYENKLNKKQSMWKMDAENFHI